LSKYIDDEDEGVLDKFIHQSSPCNEDQSPNQCEQRETEDT